MAESDGGEVAVGEDDVVALNEGDLVAVSDGDDVAVGDDGGVPDEELDEPPGGEGWSWTFSLGQYEMTWMIHEPQPTPALLNRQRERAALDGLLGAGAGAWRAGSGGGVP